MSMLSANDPIPKTAIPRRHGADLAYARRATRTLRRLIRGDAEPSLECWRALGEALLDGDEPIDRLLEWMTAEGLSRTKPLFDLAAERGIAAVPHAPEPLREFFVIVERPPAWVDPAKLERGARASALTGKIGPFILRDWGLLAGYRASSLNRTLVLTGALEKGPQRRIAETTKWWIDCTRPGGMQPFGPGYRSTLQVRLIHGLVRRHVRGLPAWDTARDGLPVNQVDMHVTYLAFSIVYLLGARVLGIPLGRADRQAVIDLWRYIGWLLGLHDRWLVDSERDAVRALYHVALAQPAPDESSRRLGSALLDEPLGYHYRRLRWIHGRWLRAVHLSVTRTLVGTSGMRELGLPDSTLPWYPLLTSVPRYVIHRLLRALPGGRERRIRKGLAEQEYLFELVAGRDSALAYAPHVIDGRAVASASA
jgi:hypothetical protein